MRSKDKQLLDAANAALAYAHANPPSDPVHAAHLDQLGGTIAHAERLAVDQGGGQSTNRAIRAKRRELRKQMVAGLLRYLVTVAQLAGAERPDLFGGLRSPRANGKFRDFATQVRAILDQAKAHTDLLVKHGLGATVVPDLEAAVAELDRLSNQILESGRSHLGATDELAVTRSKLVEQLAVLDGIYRYLHAGSPERLATWASVRKVATIGRRSAAAPAPAGEKGQVA